MPWKVFAEDEGTGLQDQSDHDYGDGANFGAHVHSPYDTQYAPSPPTLDVDYTVPEVTLGEAQYKLKATDVSSRTRDGVQTTWPEATFVAKAPQTTVSLTDNTVNYIYVAVDLTTTGDDGQYVVNTTESAPAEPSLKVAEIDTSADTATTVNTTTDAEPQVRELTVEDWESGALDTDVWEGDTGQFKVQPTTAESGEYALQGITDSNPQVLVSSRGLKNYPQPSDTFSVSILLTSTSDNPTIRFSANGASGDYKDVSVEASSDVLQFHETASGTFRNITAVDAPVSSHLNEWLEVVFDWKDDGGVDAYLYDSTGSLLSVIESSPEDWTNPTAARGVGFVANGNSSSEMYFDSAHVKRPIEDYLTETQKGTTELGNEVTPSGAVHTGPQEAPTNAPRAEYATAPVTDEATQGEQSLLTLLKSGVNPALYMERTFDGQGGAYGHRLQAPLGRFARVNAALKHQYSTFAYTDWVSGSGGGTYTLGHTSDRPRRFIVSHDGSGNDVLGAVYHPALVSHDVLGSWRITFRDVSFTDNGNTAENYLLIGVSDADPTASRIDSTGNAVIYRDSLDVDRVLTVNGGTASDTTGPQVDWSSNHDVTLEFDGSEASLYIDGEFWASVSDSPRGDMRPVIQLRDGGGNTTSDTVEVEDVTVEPLPEVLN